MMLYKNEVTDFFDIVTGELPGDTLAPYLFIICLDYVLRTLVDVMKQNGFTLIRPEAEDTSHERFWTRTTQMI